MAIPTMIVSFSILEKFHELSSSHGFHTYPKKYERFFVPARTHSHQVSLSPEKKQCWTWENLGTQVGGHGSGKITCMAKIIKSLVSL